MPRPTCLAALAAVLFTLTAQPAAAADEPSVLITGASRGIGFALAREYAQREWRVIATCRNPETADALQALAEEYENIVIERLDVTNFAQVDELAARYVNTTIDVLLNNAGISGGAAAQQFGNLDYDVYRLVLEVNVLGPLKVTEAFLPSVAASKQKKVVNISSAQGSITRNRGSWPFYRSSKSALNMVTNTLAIDLRDQGIIFGLITPGWVRTDFTRGREGPGMIDPDRSAAAVVGVIDGLTLEDSGKFLRQTGESLGW